MLLKATSFSGNVTVSVVQFSSTSPTRLFVTSAYRFFRRVRVQGGVSLLLRSSIAFLDRNYRALRTAGEKNFCIFRTVYYSVSTKESFDENSRDFSVELRDVNGGKSELRDHSICYRESVQRHDSAVFCDFTESLATVGKFPTPLSTSRQAIVKRSRARYEIVRFNTFIAS